MAHPILVLPTTPTNMVLSTPSTCPTPSLRRPMRAALIIRTSRPLSAIPSQIQSTFPTSVLPQCHTRAPFSVERRRWLLPIRITGPILLVSAPAEWESRNEQWPLRPLDTHAMSETFNLIFLLPSSPSSPS
ncbi:hypothetical protein BGW80DRAFT_1310719 [Lactifluus volemus]|nr:hypothetical protein BGW80DRAFT_1310719 [Lactifluus volemus]